MKITIVIAAAILVVSAQPGLAQAGRGGGGGGATFPASGRVVTELTVAGGGGAGARIVLDYGQPHARGREVWGTLVPFDSVWRLGANRATHFTTDVPLTIGGARVPAGSYTLAFLASRSEPRLIISSRTRQWGVPYSSEGELHRIAVRSRRLAEAVESLTLNLVPTNVTGANAPGTGTLTIAWGNIEYAVDFTAR